MVINQKSIKSQGGKKMLMRKSNFDIDNASNILSGIVFVGILLAVLVLVIAIIFGLEVFETYGVNETTSSIRDNVINMVANFFEMAPIIGTILAVVILVAVIVLLVIYVSRMRNTGSSSVSTFAG
jgi:uncharacterized integral membrane protein